MILHCSLDIERKKGELVFQRHDEIKFELQDLAAKALIPSVFRDEPQIYPGRSVDDEETEGMSTPTKERGDLYLLGIIENCILDVRITNLDAPSSIHRKEKTKKNLQTCLDERRHFFPFVVSYDEVLGNEAKVL